MSTDGVTRARQNGGGDAGHILLEREHELAACADALGTAAQANGQVIVVVGRAGIGKSSLLAEVRRLATSNGFTVLTARASELEREFPFGIVRQLFERAVRAAPEWWDGAATQARIAFDGSPDDDLFTDVSGSVLHGLYWLTANASVAAPLLLSVDDLQWCDRSSLRFLSYLARRIDGLPVVVAASLRTSASASDDPALAELVTDPTTLIVAPQPLSAPAVATVLRTGLGREPDDAFAEHCHRVTGGNPLLVDELTRAMRADGVRPDIDGVEVIAELGPRAVSRTVLLRLARLGTDAAKVAEALAVVGDGEPATIVAAVAGLDLDAVEEASRALVRAEIIEPGPEFRFVHPLVRDAVYRDLSAVELERRHLLAADLQRHHDRPAEHIAAHAAVLQPAGRQWVVHTLHDAALRAVRRGAPDNALSYLRRALAEPPDDDDVRTRLLVELGLAESLANEPVAAIGHLQAAAGQIRDPAELGAIAGLLARLLIFTNPPDDAVEVIRRARADLPDDLAGRRDLDAGLAAVELYAVNFGARDIDTAARLAAVAPPGPDATVGERMLAATAAWDRALTGGTADSCRDLASQALADGELVAADPWFMAIVAAGVLVLADDPHALDTWQDMLATGRRRGSQLTIAGVQLWQGWNQLEWGALDDADESLRNYVDGTLRRDGQDESGMPYGAAFQARLRLERGDPAGAADILRQVRRPVAGSDGDLVLRRARIELDLHTGDWAAALTATNALQVLRPRVVNPAWLPRGLLQARALAGAERYDEAGAAALVDVAAARRWGAASTIGTALRVLGEIQDAAGTPECLDTLEESLAHLTSSPARLEEAKAVLALGSARRRRGQTVASRPLLTRAGELATRCGATPLAERAMAELRVAGGRPRGRAVSGVDALTPSERRVAELASTGRTNRAIAEELYVTPKTVEVHLSSAYRKLGIRTRNELSEIHWN